MSTKTTKKNTAVNWNNPTDTAKPSLPKTLTTLQYLRTGAKSHGDKEIHPRLDEAYKECKSSNMLTLFERVMLHIGDVSRQHNILREAGILSKTGGSQERKTFRSIMRWWEKNMPASFERNLQIFAEFTLYENLMYYKLTTDRNKGTVQSEEILMPVPAKVHEFLASQIRKGKDLNLIARHLPKPVTGQKRKASFKIKSREGVDSFEWQAPKKEWVKVDGKSVEPESTITVKGGEMVSYPRPKQTATLKRQKYVNNWISEFRAVMGWSMSDYTDFRKMQNTPEQKFSSGTIDKMAKSDFDKMLDTLTSGQRFRVARMVAYKKDDGTLCPRDKWSKLGQWYIDWEKAQEKVADELRKAAATGDKVATEKLKKEFKVKSTGKQTIDILKEMLDGKMNDTQINNTYQSLIEKMDLVANVFPVIDGSGSMDAAAEGNGWGRAGKGQISRRDVAYAMAIAFSTRNPVDEFRNTYGWFSHNFHIVGHSKYKDTRPNKYLAPEGYIEKGDAKTIISAGNTFTENLKRIRQSDPDEVSSTNMGAVVDYFIKLVQSGKFHVEELPQAILYITDNEHNTGDSPSKVLQRASAIGWNPLSIFWGITEIREDMKRQFMNTPNCLLVGGFNEGVLSQILRGIKGGSVNPEDELWSINDDKRYSVITS